LDEFFRVSFAPRGHLIGQIVSDIQDMSEPSAPKLVEELLAQAAKAGASDVHLQMAGKTAQVAFRLDGLMAPVRTIPGEIAERVFGRIKFLARLKTYQESLPQDGRIDAASIGANTDIRVATYPTVTGEKIVLRLFQGAAARKLSELEFPEEVLTPLEKCLKRSSGLLLLTGPAGSGKTTTIYSCLRYLAELGGRHIITVEDPVEQVIPGVMQTEVQEARGLDFAKAARHLLRQDPQVLAIGEIRDGETAAIAVRAALTGHLVISTLHAGSCHGVVERLLTLCPDASAVISGLEMILNQRLARCLCRECEGRGCPACLGTGYRGRAPIVEWVRMDDPLRRALRQQGPQVLAAAEPLETAGRRLAASGRTNDAELERILGL
jgi:general secretion pathway protein E